MTKEEWGDLSISGFGNWLNREHENIGADTGMGRVGERERSEMINSMTT